MKLEELEKARIAQAQSDRHVYFDDVGNIVYYGRADTDDYAEYSHALFTYEQCKIFEDPNNNKTQNDYLVMVNPNEEGVYSFVTKVIELEKFKSATKMLSQIRMSTATDFDIKIHTDKKDLTIILSERLRNNVTKKVNIENFTFKGQQRMSLYITSLDDPHFLYDSIEFSLHDLFKEGELKFSVEHDTTNKSIFTRKIFNKYIRVA
tara:strand:+ start:1714 stop:2331 length:618 start_codon:yes stop_codon:yes gene_type:complete